ncbi:MAG: hypothetical protein HY318_12360, partial [Armatimonadetes bacterium]|nr:hypothetical protein [Armatimonadota bacterium]
MSRSFAGRKDSLEKQVRLMLPMLAVVASVLGMTAPALAVVIDFTGGTAYLSGGGSVTTTDNALYNNVDYYEENGFRVDFVGGDGCVGNYYEDIAGCGTNNSVFHVHMSAGGGGTVTSVVVTKIGGGTFDITYMDETSNTQTGGGAASGNERSYVTPSGGSPVLLPSSDWGRDKNLGCGPGDGVERIYFDNSFLGITSLTITSENAYCFGLDSWYMDEAPPGAKTVAFTSASQSSAGESGTITVTAQLSAVHTADVTVPFTVSGTATGGGTDYTITGTITIPAGQLTGTATITITPDSLDEDDETVILTMGTPTNASKGATTVHTATITDDDPAPTVQFTSAGQTSAGESGTMPLTAQLSAISGKNVTVPFTRTGTATDGTDYT